MNTVGSGSPTLGPPGAGAVPNPTNDSPIRAPTPLFEPPLPPPPPPPPQLEIVTIAARLRTSGSAAALVVRRIIPTGLLGSSELEPERLKPWSPRFPQLLASHRRSDPRRSSTSGGPGAFAPTRLVPERGFY